MRTIRPLPPARPTLAPGEAHGQEAQAEARLLMTKHRITYAIRVYHAVKARVIPAWVGQDDAAATGHGLNVHADRTVRQEYWNREAAEKFRRIYANANPSLHFAVVRLRILRKPQ